MCRVKFYLFGSLQVSGCPNYVDQKVPRSIQPLLAFLLLNRTRLHDRRFLSEMLWEGVDPARAQRCLSTALWRLNRCLEAGTNNHASPIIVHPSGEIGFDRKSHYWLDIEIFERRAGQFLAQALDTITQASAGKLVHAMALYRGDLLEPFYDDWALSERERLRNMYLDCLLKVASYYELRSEFSMALHYGRALIALDPLREDVYRLLIRLYAKSGDRARAIRQYGQCRDILEEELNIPPMEETQALYSSVLASAKSRSPRDPKLLHRDGAELVTESLHRAKRHAAKTRTSLEHVWRKLRRAKLNMEETTASLDESLGLIEGRSNPREPK